MQNFQQAAASLPGDSNGTTAVIHLKEVVGSGSEDVVAPGGASGGSGGFPGKPLIIPLYTLIFLLSVVGNLLVILTLARNRRMVTVTNVFLLNLAISDLLLGVFCIPTTLVGQLLQNFVFGSLMCKIIPYFQGVSVSVGVWTLVAISIERYFAICRPLHSRKWQTKSHAYKIIIVLWIISLLSNLPITVVSQLTPIGDSGRSKCRESWPNLESEKVFNVVLGSFLLVVPLCVMVFSYSLIVSKLWKGLRRDLHSRAARSQQENNYLPTENSLEFSSRSHSAHSLNIPPTPSSRSNEVIMLKGGRGMVVRWKRKYDAGADNSSHQSVVTLPRSTSTVQSNNFLKMQRTGATRVKNGSCSGAGTGGTSPLPGKIGRQGLKLSKAIRSSYTEQSIESKKKVIRMLFVLVAEFFICWTPLYVMHLWYLFKPEAVYKVIGPLGVTLIQLLAYSSSCSNPITYCFMNRRFRFAFLKLFQSLRRPKKLVGLPTIEGPSELSANSLVFAVPGSTLNKSEVLVMEVRRATVASDISIYSKLGA